MQSPGRAASRQGRKGIETEEDQPQQQPLKSLVGGSGRDVGAGGASHEAPKARKSSATARTGGNSLSRGAASPVAASRWPAGASSSPGRPPHRPAAEQVHVQVVDRL